MAERADGASRRPPLIVVPAAVFLAIFLLYPLGLTIAISVFKFDPRAGMIPALVPDNYLKLIADNFYAGVIANTLRISIMATGACLLLGYPLAYWITTLRGPFRAVMTFCVLAPLMVSVAIRTLGWIVVLSNTGLINQTLIGLGLISSPIQLLYNEFAVVLGLTEALLPFMILSLLASLQAIPGDLRRAAAITGATPFAGFLRVTLPLSLPGIAAGSLLVFALATSSFVTPRILGGGHTTMIANMVVDNFLVTLNWPFGSAIGIVLLMVVMLIFIIQHWLTERYLGRFR